MTVDSSGGGITLLFGLFAFALPLVVDVGGEDRSGENREEKEEVEVEVEVEGGDDRDEAEVGEGSIEGVISGSGSRLTILWWSADIV